mmetsp:Transcript_2461/g.5232  ORF Transcript_2461/g.5232 Transcript_2461/m.5232 type:complete len:82 (+) Transcript_2461:860-1105(+)
MASLDAEAKPAAAILSTIGALADQECISSSPSALLALRAAAAAAARSASRRFENDSCSPAIAGAEAGSSHGRALGDAQLDN